MLSKAIEIAAKAHAGQSEKDGPPYILHAMRVMLNCKTETEQICATLHDVIEDTDYTFDDLKNEGFSDEVLTVIDCLTHRSNESYEEYIARILPNQTACRVKLADLTDNMDLTRIKNPSESDAMRMQRYSEALKRVDNALSIAPEVSESRLMGFNNSDKNCAINTILSRYTCRDYQDISVPHEILRTIAHSAVAAPSGMNNQPWKVVVVKNSEFIAELEAEGIKNLSLLPDKSAYERIISRGGKLFYGAPSIIFIPIKSGADTDCGIIAQNIALAATAMHLGSCICGLAAFCFSGEKKAEFTARLNFPEGYEFGLAVLLGYVKTPGTPHEPDISKIYFAD